jgi:hypothetical protein
MRRTQLYLEDTQYRWLKAQAGRRGSMAGVVRGLIDAARSSQPGGAGDPLIRNLLADPAADGKKQTTVQTLDREVYGR